MADLRVHKALESIANATRQRDDGPLCESLIQTLRDLLPVESAAFVDIAMPESSAELARDWPESLTESRREIAALAMRGHATTLAMSSGRLFHALPVSEERMLAVSLRDSDREQLRLIETIGRVYSNFTALIRESEQDRLTGLANRRSFDAQIARLADLSLTAAPAQPRDTNGVQRQPLRWWLALFDVDHFKRINDNFGHLYGDEVLLLLARILRQCFRGEDRCFRYGGEEFAVLLARNDQQGVTTAMERLRQRIEQFPFPQVGRVTVSTGCSELAPGLAPASVIDRADRALYRAKQEGRNTIRFEPPTEETPVKQVQVGSVELF